MLKTLWLDKKITYDGAQLAPLTNYLEHGLLGNSMVAWLGSCDVTPQHMIDGEDLRAGETIAADEMVHFVLEIFDFPLKGAVVLQRLMAEMAVTAIRELQTQLKGEFVRKGDDIYFSEGKLNISIATISSNSTLIHFAVNHLPSGAPVKISSLADFKIDGKAFAALFMKKMSLEFSDIIEASQKIRSF